MDTVAPGASSTRTLFDALARELVKDGVFVGMSYGHRALKASDGGRGSLGFACLEGDHVAFRLPVGTVEHDEARAVDGAFVFSPSSLGEPLDDWIAVPPATVARWPAWARAALASSAA